MRAADDSAASPMPEAQDVAAGILSTRGARYACLVADPPWAPRDKLPGRGRGAAKHYDVLTTSEIMAFALPPLAEDAILFLWRLSSMPQDGLDVVHAWGFTPKSEIVWRKTRAPSGKMHFGMGRYVRASHETCIVATRGHYKVASKSVRSVFDAPLGRHSQKPEAFFDLVELLAAGPYVELFARRARPGWTCLGDQAPQGDP